MFSTTPSGLGHREGKSATFNRDGLVKDYQVSKESQWQKRMSKVAEDFVPKPEYTRVKFDANIRHRMDTIPNSLIYRAVDGTLPPVDEPQSMYASV